MKKLFIAFATIATLLASCSKERSIDSNDPNAPQTPGSTPGELLVRMVAQAGTDSTVNQYGYDGQNRLNSLSVTSSDVNFINEDYKLIRNSSGQITKSIYRSTELAQFGLDSVVYNVFYNAGKNQYTHKILSYEVSGGTYKDSTAYTYGSQNRIVKEESFIFNPIDNTYFPFAKNEYVFSGNNLAKMVAYYYDEDTEEYILFSDDSYEYDNKINPLILGNEGILIAQHGNFSSNNPVKQTSVYPDDPSYNFSVTAAYTYNNKNKPVDATITEQGTGGTFNMKYYYR